MDVRTPASLSDLGAVSAPQHIVFTQPLISSDLRENRRKAIFRIGRAEVVMAVISTVLGISVAIVAANAGSSRSCQSARKWSYSSQGIWCGLILATTGALGVGVNYIATKRLFVANMTMAIISSVVLGIGLYFSVFAGLSTALWCSQPLVGLHACVAIACFSSMVITIVHAAYCCGGICCRSSNAVLPYTSHGQQQIAHATQHQRVNGPNGQMTILTSASQAPSAPRQQDPPPAYVPQKATRNVKEGVLLEGLI